MSESLREGTGTQGAPLLLVVIGGRPTCMCVCVCLVNSRNVKHHLSISSNSVAVSHSQVITTVHFQKFSIFPMRLCPTEP